MRLVGPEYGFVRTPGQASGEAGASTRAGTLTRQTSTCAKWSLAPVPIEQACELPWRSSSEEVTTVETARASDDVILDRHDPAGHQGGIGYRLDRRRWCAMTVLPVLIFGAVSGSVAPWDGDSTSRLLGFGVSRCVLSIRCEAEDGVLGGTRSETPGAGQWPGFSGRSFVVGFEHPATSLAWRISGVRILGRHPMVIRYSNYQGQDGRIETRSLTLSVNGRTRQVLFAATRSWSAWDDAFVPDIGLAEGDNTARLEFTDHDTGRVNIDFIEVY